MIGKHCRAVGWFRRSSYQIVDLATIEVDGNIIKSYTRFWGIITGLCLIVIGAILWFNKIGV